MISDVMHNARYVASITWALYQSGVRHPTVLHCRQQIQYCFIRLKDNSALESDPLFNNMVHGILLRLTTFLDEERPKGYSQGGAASDLALALKHGEAIQTTPTLFHFINVFDAEGRTAIFNALEAYGNGDPQVKKRSWENIRAIHDSITARQRRFLLQLTDRNGYSLLMAAVDAGLDDTELLYILEGFSDAIETTHWVVRALDNDGWSVLDYCFQKLLLAAEQDHEHERTRLTNIAQVLLTRGALLFRATPHLQRTPLMNLCWAGRIDISPLLVQTPSFDDVQRLDSQKLSALCLCFNRYLQARKFGDELIAQICIANAVQLIRHGAIIQVHTFELILPEMLIAASEFVSIIKNHLCEQPPQVELHEDISIKWNDPAPPFSVSYDETDIVLSMTQLETAFSPLDDFDMEEDMTALPDMDCFYPSVDGICV